MIGIEQWRAVIGCFVARAKAVSQPVTRLQVGKRLCTHRHCVVLFVVVAALMLCGDVEANPGPVSAESKEILDEIRALRQEQNENFNDLRKEMKTVQAEIRGIKDQLEVQRLDIDAVNTLVEGVEDRVCLVEGEVERLEQYSRRENVILYGLPEENNESGDRCRGVVLECFNSSTKKIWDHKDFTRVHRLGPKRADRTPRPVIVRLQHHDDKFLLFAARDAMKTKGIGVANDLTPKQRAELRRLREAGQRGFFKAGKLHVAEQEAGRNERHARSTRDGDPAQTASAPSRRIATAQRRT